MHNRIVHAPDAKECSAKIVVRFGIGRIYLQRFFIMVDRIINLAFLNQTPAEVIMRFRIIRPQRRWPVDNDLSPDRRFAMLTKNDPQIVMRHPASRDFFAMSLCTSVTRSW